MPTKNLVSSFARDGFTPRSYKFGGGAETIFTADADEFGDQFPFGYNINTRGGDDIIYGSSQNDDLTGGDGDDTIYGGDGEDIINGGNAIDGSDASKGQNPPPTNLLVGDGTRQPNGTYSTDVYGASGSASNDTINGGDGGSTNRIYGDYSFISVAQDATYTGGMDTVTGGDSAGTDIADNDVFGDGETVILGIGSTFNGGIDTITGGSGAENTIYGDVFSVGFSTDANFNGGNDVLTGGAGPTGFNILYGDSSGVTFTPDGGANGESFIGGVDMLTGGANSDNDLYGDVLSISNDGDFTGGNDILTGGANGTNTMIGDANSFSGTLGSFTGGNDTLISGANANDTMTGDYNPNDWDFAGAIGGEDRFVFDLSNGADIITDFRSTDDDDIGATPVLIGDKIDFSAMATLSFATFDTSDGLSGGPDGILGAGDSFITITGGGDTVIDLGAATGTAGTHTVTVADVTGLVETDFVFVFA